MAGWAAPSSVGGTGPIPRAVLPTPQVASQRGQSYRWTEPTAQLQTELAWPTPQFWTFASRAVKDGVLAVLLCREVSPRAAHSPIPLLPPANRATSSPLRHDEPRHWTCSLVSKFKKVPLQFLFGNAHSLPIENGETLLCPECLCPQIPLLAS